MIGGVALFVIFVGLLTKSSKGEPTIISKYIPKFSGSAQATPKPNMKEIIIGKTKISATIADNDTTRSKGLGGVTNLAPNEGMLFVFSSKNITPSFWMKGMLIPIDFIWISNGKVSQIDPNAVPPVSQTPDNQLKIYTPNRPIDYVLEVNAGFAEKNNIKAGDSVILNF